MIISTLFPVRTNIIPSLGYFGLRKYRESKWGKCTNTVKLSGKVALVTGANSGIGFEIAKELAARDAEVILACRSLEKAASAIEKIRKSLFNDPRLIPMELDLASLKSVKTFCEHVKQEYSEINILINNAGVSYPRTERLQTTDGFEIHFGTNHLGHFYLTNLLEDLVARAQGRIIVVASTLHEKGNLDLHALKSLQFAPNENLYANSKLANVYFAQELAKRSKEKGIKVYAICPGWAYTGLFRHAFKWYHVILVAPIAFFFMRSSKQASETAIYCATEPSLEKETGFLYRDCKKYNSKAILYDQLAKDLWRESEEMINSIVVK
ncbi:retinol dehydrogenase 11-like [Anthonomus grandis grandis]|uniref:retinol dehydrogenase 11-like n=1 Tax=Anthonomus grandis grandis TaxID=2921223 RepID=UPI0021661993|nr:retinol dehydrogenase 11-like [Anthonomus grandis grandis]